MNNTTASKTKVLVITAVLAGLSTVIYLLLDIPIIPFAPHLKVNFSDVPALVAALAVSPMAGMVTVAVRCIIHALISGAETFYIGDIINFLIGTAMVLPFSAIYRVATRKIASSGKNRRDSVISAALSMAAGAMCAVIAGIISNLIFYPIFMSMMGLMIESPEAFILYMFGVVNTNLARAVMNFAVFALLLPVIPRLRQTMYE